MQSPVKYFLSVLLLITLAACETSQPPNFEESEDLNSLLIQGIEETSGLEFERAHSTLTSLLKKAEDEGNSKYIILANLNLGALYHHFNAQDEALKYFFQSLETSEKTGNTDYLNSIYNNIGIIYMQNDSREKSAEFITKALEISKLNNEQGKVGMNLINLGITLDELDRDDEAIASFEEAKQIFESRGDQTNLSAAINNIGTIYLDQGKYHIAYQNFLEAYRLSSASEQIWYQWEYSLNLGKCLYHFNTLDSAKMYIQQSIKGFESTKNTALLIDSYQWLAKIEEKAGRPEAALAHLEMTNSLKDSLLEEKTSKWISELQMNYEFGKKEKELELLKESTSRTQTIWIGAVSGGLAIVFLLILTMRTSNQNLRQKNVILKQEQAVSQLKFEKNEAQREKLKQEMQSRERLNLLEKQKLQQEIEFRDRELVGKAMNLVNKNEVFGSLQEILSKCERSNYHPQKAIKEALSILKSAKNMEQDWESFKMHFEEVNPNFFSKLSRVNPSLSAGDLRMCAYLTLNLTAKEIAQIFNISPDSVRKRKQRLREKLNLSRDHDLTEWLRNIPNLTKVHVKHSKTYVTF